MGWSEERVALLRKLWTEGLSASQIAKQLGGVTRNAVIGAEAGVALPQLLLYDATVTVAGLMLFPTAWNP